MEEQEKTSGGGGHGIIGPLIAGIVIGIVIGFALAAMLDPRTRKKFRKFAEDAIRKTKGAINNKTRKYFD